MVEFVRSEVLFSSSLALRREQISRKRSAPATSPTVSDGFADSQDDIPIDRELGGGAASCAPTELIRGMSVSFVYAPRSESAAMFAPKIAKAQTRAAERPAGKLAPQRSAVRPFRCGAVEWAHMLQRSIGNQAMLQLLAQQASISAGNEPGSGHRQEGSPENITAQEAPRRIGRDFSEIPIFPPDRLNQPQAPSAFAVPSLPGIIIQPKLAVGPVDDPLEREADRVADQVARMPESELSITGCVIPAQPQMREAEDRLSRAGVDSGSVASAGRQAPATVREVLRSPGQPLDPAAQAFMEPRFGQDFSRVRIHTGTKAAESARAVNAVAYTVGQDIVFGAGLYVPTTDAGRKLLAHELTHTVQQRLAEDSPSVIANGVKHRSETDVVTDGTSYQRPAPLLESLNSRLVLRQQLSSDEPLSKIERNTELLPHVIPMDAPAVREVEKCEEFPGGSTECEVDTTGTPTGKVTHRIDEKNPCTRPCVEQHEAVHVKQLEKFCPQLRDCYLAADKGKRPLSECYKMAIFESKERECAAYKVSVPCVEKRLKTSKECQSTENKEYGTRKLKSEKCFRDNACK